MVLQIRSKLAPMRSSQLLTSKVTSMLRRSLAVLGVVTLSACDSGNGASPSALSEGEEAALEEAAKMLDEKRLPEGAMPDVNPPAPAEPSEQNSAE